MTIHAIDMAVIGGGPAGMAAALAAYEEGVRNIVIFERDNALGGILQQCIHNGFGLHIFNEELTGPEYAARYISKIDNTNISVKLNTMVLHISQEKKITAVNSYDGILEYYAKTIILAMGCRERTRGALNIPGFRPSGIFTAGTAQRLVNIYGYMPGSKVVILGSGDIGLIMARRMTWEGAKVELVCELMPYSTGLNRNIIQCLHDYEIPILYEHTITQIHGKARLKGVTISKVNDLRKPIEGTEKYIECDTLLLSVGLIPENELSKDAGIDIDPITGGAIVNQDRQTSINGIYACGNALHVHDMVDNVSNEAVIAGYAAAKYIKSSANKKLSNIKINPGNGIRYIIPQFLSSCHTNDSCNLFFRVDAIYHNVILQIRTEDDAIVVKKKIKIATPGEMQIIHIDRNSMNQIHKNKPIYLEIV